MVKEPLSKDSGFNVVAYAVRGLWQIAWLAGGHMDQRRPTLSEVETPFCSPVTRPKTDQKTVEAPRARSCRSRSCAWHFQGSPEDAVERASLRAGGGVRTRGWTTGAGTGLQVGKGPRCSQRSGQRLGAPQDLTHPVFRVPGRP